MLMDAEPQRWKLMFYISVPDSVVKGGCLQKAAFPIQDKQVQPWLWGFLLSSLAEEGTCRRLCTQRWILTSVLSEVSVWPTTPRPCEYAMWPHGVTHLRLNWHPSSRMKSSLWRDAELHNMYESTFLSSDLYFCLPRRWEQGARGMLSFFSDVDVSALGRSSRCPLIFFSQPPYSAVTLLHLSILIPLGF